VGVNAPARVFVGDQLIEPLSEGGAAPVGAGWRYDDSRRALLVRFTQASRQSNIRIEW